MTKSERESKDFFQNEYAMKNNYFNSVNENLTKKQHEAIQKLCADRHYMHCNSAEMFNSHSNSYDTISHYVGSEMTGESEINAYLAEVEFQKLNFKDYDDCNTLETYDSDIDGEYDDYCFDSLNQISKIAEYNDRLIINYLGKIDKEYGTEYCPTMESRKIM
jgi:hypothetical protein